MQAKITTHKLGNRVAVLILLMLTLCFTTAGAQTIGMVASNITKSVTIFDADTDAVLGAVSIPTFGSVVGDCAVLADGTLGFVTNFASSVYVIDLTTLSLAAGINPIPISNPGEDIAISPDGKYLVVSDGGAIAPLSVIDIATRTEINTFSLGLDCNSVDVCADGSVLATSFYNQNVRRLTIDGAGNITDTGESLSVSVAANNVFCAPGGASGLVVTRSSGNLQSFSIPGLSVVDTRSFSGAFGISGIVNAAGDRVYVRSNSPGSVDMFGYNAATGELSATPLATISVDDTPTFYGVDQIALSPDQSKLYVSQRASLDVYDASTLDFITSISDASISFALGVAFGPAVQSGKSYTILAAAEVTLQKDAYVEGDIHANENAAYKKRSMQIGNATASAEIEIHPQSLIDGDATAPLFDFKGGADESNVSGTVTVATVDAVPLPSIPAFSTGSEDVEVENDATVNLAPGAYAGVKVREDATLNLAHDGSSGDYFFESLELGKRATVNLDATLGEVNLYIDGELDFIHDATFNAFDGPNPTEKVTIWSTEDGSIKVREDVIFNGCNLIAPDAKIEFHKRSFFKGSVSAREVNVHQTASVVNHQSILTPEAAQQRAWAIYKDDLNTANTGSVLPATYELSQNFPNPFNPTTTIRFALPEAATVSLKVYNIHGQLVRTLANGSFSAGSHHVTWDGTNENGVQVVSGMYFYQIHAGDFQQVKKMLMLK